MVWSLSVKLKKKRLKQNQLNNDLLVKEFSGSPENSFLLRFI